jgi:hypothetical protein
MGSVSRTTKKRAGGVLTVFAIVAALIIGFATPAFAHHSEIEAGADCENVVTWTATAWTDSTPTQQERTNQNVRVWYRVGNVAVPSGTPVAPAPGDVEVTTGAFNIGNGYSFGGTFAMPAGQTTITVFVQEQVKWGTATPPTGAGVATARRAVVTLPTDCPTPDITIEVECTKVTITSTKDLSNIIWQKGDAPSEKVDGLTGTTYELVNDPSNPITAVWVKSGNNKVVSPPDPLPNPPNNNNQGIGAYFAVAAPTGCDGVPKVESKAECTETGGLVTLTLSNTAAAGLGNVEFVVSGPGTPDGPTTVSVAPGASKTLKFSGVADPSATYKITANGKALPDQVLTINCNGVPKVESSSVCSETGGVVSLVLSNTAPAGNKSVEFVVSGPGTPDGPTTVSVAPGASKTIKFSGVADPSATYEITADGVALPDQILKIDCNGVPKVESKVECTTTGGLVTITLSNTAPSGNKPVEFVVSGPGTADGPTTVSVAAGSSKVIKFSGVADGTATYTVTADGKPQADQVLQVNCAGVPKVESKVECTTTGGLVTITLSNTAPANYKPVTFVVTPPTGDPVQRVVAAGGSVDVTFPNLPDGSATFKVTADGKAQADQTLTVNCSGVPDVESSSVCSATGGIVTLVLTNTAPVGNKPVEFVVSGPGTPDGPTTVSVAAGSSKTLKFTGVADGTATYTVTADGKALEDQVLDIDCAGVGAATVAKECVDNDGKVIITLTNESEAGKALPIEFVVKEGDEVLFEGSVAAGASKEVVLDGVPDGPHTYTVTADGKPLTTLDIVVECDDPGIPVVDGSVECTALGGDITITLENDGVPGKNLPVTFRVTDPRDDTFQDVTVDPGQTKTVTLPGFEDGEVTIPVVVVNGLEEFAGVASASRPAAEVNLDQTVDVACQPVATIECAASGLLVTVRNGGDVEAEFTVLKNGTVVDTVTVPAFGGTVPVNVPADEGETLTISVEIDGVEAFTQTTTRDCEPPPPPPPTQPEVLGAIQTPASPVTTTAALPYTGGEVLRTLLLGLGLGLVGFALVGVARRRRS